MRCPNCKTWDYRTVKTEPLSKEIVRTLKCMSNRCGHVWKSVEQVETGPMSLVLKTDKEALRYNKRIRVFLTTMQAVTTYELIEGDERQPITLDLFDDIPTHKKLPPGDKSPASQLF